MIIQRDKKTYLILFLIILSIATLSYSAFKFYKERVEILTWLSDVLNKVALPYRILELTAKPEDDYLLIPIRGLSKSQIDDTWGAARSAGRTHEGVDIFASRGTAVFSATDGYVLRVGTSTLGGNFVFVIGGGGVRYYYAHLDRIAHGIERGEKVTTDTVLGFVGNTGNASTTPPHLHFGMYLRGAQNPFELLVERDEKY